MANLRCQHPTCGEALRSGSRAGGSTGTEKAAPFLFPLEQSLKLFLAHVGPPLLRDGH